MDGHLVPIEIGIESLTGERMKVNGITFDEDRLKGLDTHAVQGWGPIQQDGMIPNNLFEDIPNFFIFALQHFLSALDGVGVTEFFQFADNERLEQFEGNFLR
jgi:hypothetical protein